MFDIHCHLLPGIDDGAQNLEQALALAKLAVSNGITHSVVTPHIHPGRYENNTAIISSTFAAFQQALEENNIALNTGFAAELRLSAEVIPLIQQNDIPFYGEYNGYRILLLECPHSHIPPGSDKLVEWLLKQNIRPMIAHPERNKDVMRSYNKLEAFIDLGCLFQLTADSVAGFFGEQAQRRAHQILSEGHATVLASDGHNIKHRPPRLKEGLTAAEALIGRQSAHMLVWDNPKAIVQDQFSQNA